MSIHYFAANTYFTSFVVSTLLLLAGCMSTATETQLAQQSKVPVLDVASVLADDRSSAAANVPRVPVTAPMSLNNKLLDFSSAPQAPKRFDVQATDVPIRRLFNNLSRPRQINVLVDPSIEGNVSLSMKSVTMAQVMNAVRDLYGYDYIKTDYGYRVLPNQIQTRIYPLNYLDISRSGRSDTNISSGQIAEQGASSPASNVTTEYAADFWSNIQQSVLSLLDAGGENRQVMINPQSGFLVLRATPREHDVVARFLQGAQGSLQRQVVIEAKIVEVTLSNEFRSGINWASLATNLSDVGASLTGNLLSPVPDVGGIFSLNFNNGDFNSVLELLSHQGDVQVLSSPRVSTVNNQKAVIKVGTDEYFVTEVTAGSEMEGTQPQFTLKPFFSGIALDVTPQISSDDYVILHVRPSVTEVVERTKILSYAGQDYSFPLALSSVRESDSIIRAASGQIVVIGGLLSQKQSDSESGVPFLSRLPGLKYLLGQTRSVQSKSELVILLKPLVHDENTSINQLDQILERL